MKTFALALLLLAGCHGYKSRCSYGPIEVLSDSALDCDAVASSGAALRRAFEAPTARKAFDLDPQASYSFETPWPVSVDFDAAFAGYTVIAETDPVSCGSFLDRGGCNSGNVTTLAAPTFWAHEALHFLEAKQGITNTTHAGWGDNGYTNLATAYTSHGPQESWFR